MLIVDTHAHVNFPDYDKDRNEVIKRALANNVWLINVGCDRKSSEEAVELAQKHDEGVFASVALHPQNIEEGFDSEIYRALINQSAKVAAIGETGLDYAVFVREQSERLQKQAPRPSADDAAGRSEEIERAKQLQKEIFIKHIELALELDKPLIIHCRNAHNDVLDILHSYFIINNSKLRGVAHSFLGNLKQARRYRELGFKIAFNGIITFARDYDKVILDTPLEDILVETDCPFLTPVPYRGQRNEPLYVIEVAQKLAEIKNIPYENVIEQTTKNAIELFRL